MQKASLQPIEGKIPDHVAVDETVIQLNEQRYWLYVAVDPEANESLHVKLGSARNIGRSELFLGELRETHDIENVPRKQRVLVCERDVERPVNAVFLVGGATPLKDACNRHGLRFRYEK